MKLKKIIKMCSVDDKIGIYRSGHFIGNFKTDNVPSEFLECKIKNIWTGIIYYQNDFSLPHSKLNITLEVNKNDQ